MKKYFYLVLIFSIVLESGCSRKPQLNSSTIAVVGDDPISLKSYKERYVDYLDATYMKDNLRFRKLVLNNMINELLLKKHDDNSGIFHNAEYRKEMAWADQEMILAYVKDQKIYKNIKVSDQELRLAFKRMNEKIAARHLYAATKEEADRLYRALQKGASFQTLARQTFTDSVLKNNGGYLGYFSWGDMDPAFENAAYQLQPGQISKPVKTAQGYSIIKVEDRKTQPIITENMFLNKKDQVERLLKISKKKGYEQQYIHHIFDESKLEFNETALYRVLDWLAGKKVKEKAKRDNETCLTYNRHRYSILNVEAMLNKVPDKELQKLKSLQALKAGLKGLLIQQILLKIGYEEHYDQIPVVRKSIRNAHNNLYLKFKRKAILGKVVISDSLLREYYRKHIKEFNQSPKINVREIIVDNKQQALKIKGMLLAGQAFDKLAMKYSLRKWSARRGGEIGLSDLARFGNFKNKLWLASPGEIVGPLEFNGMYGMFTVIEKRKAHPLPFDRVRDQVIRAYRQDRATELTRIYLQRLKQGVQIQINKKLLQAFTLKTDS